eukprot:1066440-Lingulodinium_polyedra.AAC.1
MEECAVSRLAPKGGVDFPRSAPSWPYAVAKNPARGPQLRKIYEPAGVRARYAVARRWQYLGVKS